MFRDSNSHAFATRCALRCAALLAICASPLLLAANPASAVPITSFVISEVMYEAIGGDNGRQWVELYNGTGSTINLSNYHLEWGRNGLSDSVGLSGLLLDDTTFIIGGPTSDGNNGNPIYNQVHNFAPNLGDGGHVWREDGIALFETGSSTMMHTVVYGGNGNNPPYVDEQGNPATVIDDSALAPGESLEYLGTGVWQVQSTPTPGAPHSNIPEPTPAVLLGLGLVMLGTLRSSNAFGLIDAAPRIHSAA
jgi:hypothetical protein